MNIKQPMEPGLELKDEELIDELRCDFRSLGNILDDIISKLNHQVIGNCEILENLEDKKTSKLLPEETVNSIKVFRSGELDALIRQPLKLSLARLNGLRRVLDRIRDKSLGLITSQNSITQKDITNNHQEVSTGNS